MRAVRLVVATLLVGAAVAVGGCASEAPGVTGDGGTGCGPQLTLNSNQAQFLNPGAQVPLSVRLADCHGVIASSMVSFQIQGDAKGASLSAQAAVTGMDGVATVTLTAGSAATFAVAATYPGAATVTFDITVTDNPIGMITVNMSYSGTKMFTAYQAFLFKQSCSSLNAYTLPTALQQAAPVTLISAHPQFTNVAVGTGYAVGVTAKNGADLLGFGCTDSLAVTGGQNTIAEVEIEDLPIIYTGTYLLDNHFDLAQVLPPSVSTILHLFDEATDDHDLTNEMDNHGNHQFGVDPAAFLLDFIFRQFCRWECTETNPSWATCTIENHASGDLRALYMQNFPTWDGCQPYVTGSCGGLELQWGGGLEVHQYLQQQVQAMIESYVPDAAQKLINIAGDLARAFTQMHIKSRLILNDIRPDAQGGFQHILDTMLVDLHDWDGNLDTYEFSLSAAGLSNLSYSATTTTVDDKLQIPEHSFRLDFGKLLQYIYVEILLKQVLGYQNTGEMFQDWIDCAQVGQWLYDNVTTLIPVATYTAFCNTGLQLAGNLIDTNIQNVISAETTMTLAGQCEAGTPLGPQRTAKTLVNGEWNGEILEGTFSGNFPGTFTGEQQ